MNERNNDERTIFNEIFKAIAWPRLARLALIYRFDYISTFWIIISTIRDLLFIYLFIYFGKSRNFPRVATFRIQFRYDSFV